MRTLFFVVSFLSSGVLFSGRLISLEQLISPNVPQELGQYLNAIGKQKIPLVRRLIADIYRKDLSIYERLKARRLLDEVFASFKFNVSILEMQILLTARHLELQKEERELPKEASSGLSVEEARKILSVAAGFVLPDQR